LDEHPTHECHIPLHYPTVREKIFFFISGLLVSVPFALFLEQFSDVLPMLISVAVVAPFIEELAKVFPLFYRHGETERSVVLLGILIGLGFGLTEFAIYVAVVGVDPLVRLPGIIFHASSAAITAYGIAKKNPFPFYLLAVGLHILNNFFAVVFAASYFSLILQLIILVVTYYLAWYFYRKASKTAMIPF
jgi:RsiW-degrading membrane proteinase PrsW (M82 family)